jgi:glyoxylase-like metal-dependent hydrolase (beta-lactamase superfamily II)
VPVNIVDVGYDSTHYFVIAPPRGSRLLVDCGWPGTMGKLKAQMRRKGMTTADVPCLLITHFHPDHAGLTQELRNEGMRLLLMDLQYPHVGELKKHIKASYGYVEIEVNGSLILRPEQSRDFLSEVGINGEIIPTPGHSPDSVSLVLDEGMAFTGDLTHPLLLTDDDVACKDSWKRIYALGAIVIYPAHGTAPYSR